MRGKTTVFMYSMRSCFPISAHDNSLAGAPAAVGAAGAVVEAVVSAHAPTARARQPTSTRPVALLHRDRRGKDGRMVDAYRGARARAQAIARAEIRCRPSAR